MNPSPELERAIVTASAVTLARLHERLRGPPPTTPQEMGYLAELLVARHFGGAVWCDILPPLRRRIHGGSRGVAAGDRGVDVVAIADGTLALIQVKWYRPGTVIGNDPFARLVSAGTACRAGFGQKDYPAMKLVHQAGSRIARGVVNRDMIEIKALSAATLRYDALAPESPESLEQLPEEPCPYDIFASDFPPDVAVPEAKRDHAAVFDDFQLDIIERVRELAASGFSLVRIQLPVGSGKSYVIAALAADYQESAEPVVVFAPRVDIVRQLAAILQERGGWRCVFIVADGEQWPFDAAAGDLIVATGQSIATKLSGDIRVAAVFVDEAHHHEGHDRASAVFITPVRFELSACLGKNADIVVEHRRAVELGLICAAEFVFAVFERAPTFDDLAAHLAAHPEHTCVLACFQSRKSARAFAAACRRAQVDARLYVSDDRDSKPENLELFKRGDVRVLCVVACVEMGTNIHRCDTVLLAEPWDSVSRTLQLVGRGCRLFPTKNGHFTVLCGVGPEDVVEHRVARLVETIYVECDAFHAETLDEVADWVDVVPGVGAGGRHGEPAALAAAIGEALADVRREVFDAFGRRLRVEGPAATLLVQYQRARELAVAAGLESYDAYVVWRAGLDDAQRDVVPVDPASEFARLPVPGFVWADYLGWSPVRNIAADLAAAINEALEMGIICADDLDTPSCELYRAVRSKTAAGKKLPPKPLAIGETWALLFAVFG